MYLLSSFLKKFIGTPCGFESVLSELFVSGMHYNVVFPVNSSNLTKRGNKGYTVGFLPYAFLNQCYTLRAERLEKKKLESKCRIQFEKGKAVVLG